MKPKFIQGFKLHNGGLFWTRRVYNKNGQTSEDWLRWGRENATHIVQLYDGSSIAVSYIDPSAPLERVKEEVHRVILGPHPMDYWLELEKEKEEN